MNTPPSESRRSTIRPARPEDWPVIAEFNRRLAAESESLELDQTTLAQGVQALLAEPSRGRYFLAEMDGQVVGQLMHTREWSDWRNGELWWLQSVYVVLEHRGSGVFRQLFETLLQAAESDPQIVGLRLYVEESNTRAHAVYARMGLAFAGYHVMERVWRNAPQRAASAEGPHHGS